MWKVKNILWGFIITGLWLLVSGCEWWEKTIKNTNKNLIENLGGENDSNIVTNIDLSKGLEKLSESDKQTVMWIMKNVPAINLWTEMFTNILKTVIEWRKSWDWPSQFTAKSVWESIGGVAYTISLKPVLDKFVADGIDISKISINKVTLIFFDGKDSDQSFFSKNWFFMKFETNSNNSEHWIILINLLNNQIKVFENNNFDSWLFYYYFIHELTHVLTADFGLSDQTSEVVSFWASMNTYKTSDLILSDIELSIILTKTVESHGFEFWGLDSENIYAEVKDIFRNILTNEQHEKIRAVIKNDISNGTNVDFAKLAWKYHNLLVDIILGPNNENGSVFIEKYNKLAEEKL